MIRAASAALPTAFETPRAPAWARPNERSGQRDDASLEAAFLAGAGLAALDAALRLEPPWLGVWRRRLALQAAAASLHLLGRREDEAALRDAWTLRRPGDDPGPAGRILAAWRALSDRSDPLDAEMVAAVATEFGFKRDEALAAIAAGARDLAASDRPAVLAAAEAANLVVAQRPDAELMALWVADAVLAARLRWPRATAPVALLAGQIFHPDLRQGAEGRRPKPGGPDWLKSCCLAYAHAAASALDLAAELGRRAERLQAAAPKLRAKAAEKVVAALLADDVLTAAYRIEGMSDRGLRRLFDRLVALEVVRELSGRAAFRLYGL